jgi:hypothetical protein
VNAVLDTEAYICIGDKRQLGLSRRQLIMALLHQAADALNRVLTADRVREYALDLADVGETDATTQRTGIACKLPDELVDLLLERQSASASWGRVPGA